jgi:hypothetical protein
MFLKIVPSVSCDKRYPLSGGDCSSPANVVATKRAASAWLLEDLSMVFAEIVAKSSSKMSTGCIFSISNRATALDRPVEGRPPHQNMNALIGVNDPFCVLNNNGFKSERG